MFVKAAAMESGSFSVKYQYFYTKALYLSFISKKKLAVSITNIFGNIHFLLYFPYF